MTDKGWYKKPFMNQWLKKKINTELERESEDPINRINVHIHIYIYIKFKNYKRKYIICQRGIMLNQ